MTVALADGLEDGLEATALEEGGLEEAGAVERGVLVEVEVEVEVDVPAVERIVDEVSGTGTCEVKA